MMIAVWIVNWLYVSFVESVLMNVNVKDNIMAEKKIVEFADEFTKLLSSKSETTDELTAKVVRWQELSVLAIEIIKEENLTRGKAIDALIKARYDFASGCSIVELMVDIDNVISILKKGK